MNELKHNILQTVFKFKETSVNPKYAEICTSLFSQNEVEKQ